MALEQYFLEVRSKTYFESKKIQQKWFDSVQKYTCQEPITAVFNWVSKNQNQSNYSGQSQRTQTFQCTNQNSNQIHVADTKSGKKVNERISIAATLGQYKRELSLEHTWPCERGLFGRYNQCWIIHGGTKRKISLLFPSTLPPKY